MRGHSLKRAGVAAAAILALSGVSAGAQTAISGMISSSEEGAMEGVVVSARRAGANFTVSVVSDDKGRFAFPERKLEPGKYTLKIRASGFDLEDRAEPTVEAAKETKVDLRLRKTRNLSAQITNAEWIASIPGTDDQKKFLLNCNGCHTYQRIFKSTYDADGFVQIFERMSTYYPGSTPMKPQVLVGPTRRSVTRGASPLPNAQWLASLNLSEGESWSYPLKTLPRAKGRATRVVITEYDLPRPTIQPHDVILDGEGTVWYSDFGDQKMGSMDPVTGKVTEYTLPVSKPGYPLGTLDIERDVDDNLWVANMYQAAIHKFDRKTGLLQTWTVPEEWQKNGSQQTFVAPNMAHVDGKVWFKNSETQEIYRLETATGKMENLGQQKDSATGKQVGHYQIAPDAGNNLYLLDFGASEVSRIDAKTKELTVWHTPTPGSRPRRGRVDEKGQVWFAEYGGNAIGMLDPKSGGIREWRLPTAFSAPYDVIADRNGEAWTGSAMTDRVARLNPATGEFVEYPLPRETNIRRVHIDNRTTPVTLWTGNNHGASIVKLEPLD